MKLQTSSSPKSHFGQRGKSLIDARINGVSIPKDRISLKDWAYAYKNQKSYFVDFADPDSTIYFNNINYDFFTIFRMHRQSLLVTEELKEILEKELFGIRFFECKNFFNN